MPSKLLARAGNAVHAADDADSSSQMPRSEVLDSSDSVLAFAPLRDIPGALDVHPNCPFDKAHLEAIDAELSAALKSDTRSDTRYVMIDFSKVDELESSGLGYLVALQKRLRAQDGELVLYALRPKLQRFIETLGFGSFFSVALDLPYAIEYIEKTVKEVFPVVAQCPVCSASMSIAKPGRGRCRACQAVLTVLPDGSVELG